MFASLGLGDTDVVLIATFCGVFLANYIATRQGRAKGAAEAAKTPVPATPVEIGERVLDVHGEIRQVAQIVASEAKESRRLAAEESDRTQEMLSSIREQLAVLLDRTRRD